MVCTNVLDDTNLKKRSNGTSNNISDTGQSANTENADTFKLVTFGLIGFLFGFILEKCKVYEPKFIRDQMIFDKFLMMKMFFSALATSMLSIFILNIIAKDKYNKVFEATKLVLKSTSNKVMFVGGLILGLGMTIGGSCPGMIFVQMGAGVNFSYLTLVGGLCAALLHGLLESDIHKISKPDQLASEALFEVLKINHFIVRGLFILLLAIGVILLEILFPWTNDYKFRDESRPFFSVTSEVWHPIIAGVCLGSLQFWSLLLLSKTLGSSSSFSTCASYFFDEKKLENYPYLKKYRSGALNYGSIAFVLGITLGSFFSSILGGAFGQTEHVHPFNALLGGFLLVYGARIAGGCNTGHGISGTSHLFIGSIVAMMSMFAGGILLAILLALLNIF